MRVNAHAHIFNLRSVTTEKSLAIVRDRIIGDDAPSFLREAVDELLEKVILKPSNFDEEEISRRLLASLQKKTGFKKYVEQLGSSASGELKVLLTALEDRDAWSLGLVIGTKP